MTHAASDTRDTIARQALVYRLPVIKGVCVLAVILMHTTASIWRPFSWSLVAEVVPNTLARFAVPLFLVMSGFYLSLHARNERPLRFYRRTLPGLVVPFVVYTVVYLLHGTPDLGLLVRTGPEHLVHGSASAHLWFIPVIIELYLLHPLLRRLHGRAARPVLVVVAFVLAQLAYAWGYEMYVRPAGDLTGWADVIVTSTCWVKFAGFFVLGYHLRDHAGAVQAVLGRRGAWTIALATWGLAGLVLPAVWATQRFAGGPDTWSTGSRFALEVLAWPLTVAAFAIVASWPVAWSVPRPARWATRVSGLYAYGIYYLHPLVLFVVARLFYTYGGAAAMPSVVRAAVFFGLVTVLTIAAVKLLVRLPFTRRLA